MNNKQLEELDVLTILSVVIQIMDHTNGKRQDMMMASIQQQLDAINKKLDYLLNKEE